MRTYEKTHPWLKFSTKLNCNPKTWMALGEIQSKCEHLSHIPLKPDIHQFLHRTYIAKGVLSTAAIEGNTLSEKEVEDRIKGEKNLPESKEYQGKEIDNILDTLNHMSSDIIDNPTQPIQKQDILNYNRTILRDLKTDDHVVPGEIRNISVGVGNVYRGAPAEDCDYLLSQLCKWLDSSDFTPEKGYEKVFGVLKAIIAHIYLAWIHPFGDGNGRTARMVEVRLLLEAGFPTDSAHLLSNHYNATRTEYYRILNQISANGGDIIPFIDYAVIGLRDQLAAQINIIKNEQIKSIWENFVYKQFRNKVGPTNKRRRKLALGISKFSGGVRLKDLRYLNHDIVDEYNGRTNKMITRDINALLNMQLIIKENDIVRPNMQQLDSFKPLRKNI